MGLLSKANLLDQNNGLAFSTFISKYNINFFAIFELRNDFYEITNSLGFDGSSILSSSSSTDFWNGIIKEDNKLFYFLTDNISNPLYQFFSFKIIDNVHNVTVFRTENKIVLICNNKLPDSVITDFKRIDYSLTDMNLTKLNSFINKDSLIYKIEFDFQEAIESYLISKKQKIGNASESLSSSIFNELSNRLLYLYNLPNSGKILDLFKVKTVFVCNSKTPKDLLINHLVLNFKEVISNSAEIISIDFSGTIENLQELKDYLQVE